MEKEENFFVYKNGRWYISGKWAFFFEHTYGIPKELLQEYVNIWKKKS